MSDDLKVGLAIFTILAIICFAAWGLCAWYVKYNNAATECIFARDVITCVQLTKKEK